MGTVSPQSRRSFNRIGNVRLTGRSCPPIDDWRDVASIQYSESSTAWMSSTTKKMGCSSGLIMQHLEDAPCATSSGCAAPEFSPTNPQLFHSHYYALAGAACVLPAWGTKHRLAWQPTVLRAPAKLGARRVKRFSVHFELRAAAILVGP